MMMKTTSEVNHRKPSSPSTSSKHMNDNVVTNTFQAEERTQVSQSAMSSSGSRDSISTSGNPEDSQIKVDISAKEIDSQTMDSHQVHLKTQSTSLDTTSDNRLENSTDTEQLENVSKSTSSSSRDFRASNNSLDSIEDHLDKNFAAPLKKSKVNEQSTFDCHSQKNETPHQEGIIGPIPYNIKVQENAPIFIESGPQTILVTHEKSSLGSHGDNVNAAKITIQQTSNLGRNDTSHVDLAMNHSSNIQITPTHSNVTNTLPRQVSIENTLPHIVENTTNQTMERVSSQNKITVTSAQPITAVSIVPGMKRAVVAQKKGRFNVLKDPIISPSQIMNGTTIPTQQGAANTIVTSSGIQPSSDELVSNITSIKASKSHDSLQHVMGRSNSPKAIKAVNKNTNTPITTAEPLKGTDITSNLQTCTSASSINTQCSAIPTHLNSNGTKSTQPSVTKKGRFTVSSARQPNTSNKAPSVQSRSSPVLVEGTSSTKANIKATDNVKQNTSTPVLKPNQSFTSQQHSLPNSETHQHHTTVITTTQHVQANYMVSEPSNLSQSVQQRESSSKMQKGPSLTSNGLSASNMASSKSNASLHSQISSDSTLSLKSNATIPKQQNFSALKGPGLSGAIPGGMGKMLHFLDQMRFEATEADKFIISLQKDMKYLREKNKELEMRCNDTERRYLEEKKAREIAESNAKCFKKKLMQLETQSSNRTAENNLVNDCVVHEAGGLDSSCELKSSNSTDDKKITPPIPPRDETSPPVVSKTTSGVSVGPGARTSKTNNNETCSISKRDTPVGSESSEPFLNPHGTNMRISVSYESTPMINDQESSREDKNDMNLELKTTSEILRDFDPFQPTAINKASTDKPVGEIHQNHNLKSSVIFPSKNSLHKRSFSVPVTAENVMQNQNLQNSVSGQPIPVLRGDKDYTFA